MSMKLTNYWQFILRKIIKFLLQSPDDKMFPETIAINKMSFIAFFPVGNLARGVGRSTGLNEVREKPESPGIERAIFCIKFFL